jgi:hypothetical protein
MLLIEVGLRDALNRTAVEQLRGVCDRIGGRSIRVAWHTEAEGG